jgi:hypothetical protein
MSRSYILFRVLVTSPLHRRYRVFTAKLSSFESDGEVVVRELEFVSAFSVIAPHLSLWLAFVAVVVRDS